MYKKYGKTAKNGGLCPILMPKKAKNGGFLRVFGCFCVWWGVFLYYFWYVGWVILVVAVDFVVAGGYDMSMRLDLALVQRNLYSTRARAVAAIKAGLVVVNGAPAKKPSQDVLDTDVVVGGNLPYSSGRGSLKLAHALDVFGINPRGAVCLDVGASTGGFTEVLLTRGASRVYAVDVGTNQLIPDLRDDARVMSLERTDIRALPVQSVVDLIVVDVSFVSLTDIVSALVPWGAKNIIVLIKPQFEVPREVAARANGVIRSVEWHEYAKNQVVECFEKCGFILRGIIQSPIAGGSGNTEFLAWFAKI